MKKTFLCVLFLLISFFSFSQEKSVLKPSKVGFLYNYATNENFIFNDVDYTLAINTYKFQAFYNLGNWKGLHFEMIVQPQVQFLKHQLINEQFITPDQDNYLDKRAEFTRKKSMNLYALEFNFVTEKKITKQLAFRGGISLGFANIDTRSERLAKGFTFIENFTFGFSYKLYKKSALHIGTNFGHISNLNFQKPNDGYNVVGLEIGYSYTIN